VKWCYCLRGEGEDSTASLYVLLLLACVAWLMSNLCTVAYAIQGSHTPPVPDQASLSAFQQSVLPPGKKLLGWTDQSGPPRTKTKACNRISSYGARGSPRAHGFGGAESGARRAERIMDRRHALQAIGQLNLDAALYVRTSDWINS
jgi:hypothetical protein